MGSRDVFVSSIDGGCEGLSVGGMMFPYPMLELVAQVVLLLSRREERFSTLRAHPVLLCSYVQGTT